MNHLQAFVRFRPGPYPGCAVFEIAVTLVKRESLPAGSATTVLP
jgi:hypothetical protein